jgi:uncharacterized cupredoxin-like copper-binding protein
MTDGMTDGMGSTDTAAFGEPGEVDMADRTIGVSMFDTFRYEPTEISVKAGETVAFEVTNEGKVPHEFVLGDRSFQEQHEAEMAEMGGDLPPDTPYALGVEPGETKTLAWTFTKEGSFTYACHVPGHFAAGMVGTITVE